MLTIKTPSRDQKKPAYTLGDVLHHSTGQGDVWLLLVIDVLYQVQELPHTLSVYQTRQAWELLLPIEKVFHTFAVLRDTKAPDMTGHVTTIWTEYIETQCSPIYPWVRIGSRLDWVSHFHPQTLSEIKTVPFRLVELVAAQDEQLRQEQTFPEPRISPSRLYAAWLNRHGQGG